MAIFLFQVIKGLDMHASARTGRKHRTARELALGLSGGYVCPLARQFKHLLAAFSLHRLIARLGGESDYPRGHFGCKNAICKKDGGLPRHPSALVPDEKPDRCRISSAS
ncbi:hypothetical protein [Novosphingobium sp. ST904]|uniref:hypothetical protein n=1 Tax=Novosphingobium sp. ST904 TaxID=1684385 RepID=UPI0010530BCF|nr:hypothetical protein [Novosphingobium sp. ST904]